MLRVRKLTAAHDSEPRQLLIKLKKFPSVVWIDVFLCPFDTALRHESFQEGNLQMAKLRVDGFDAAAFLANTGLGRRIVQLKAKHVFFSQ